MIYGQMIKVELKIFNSELWNNMKKVLDRDNLTSEFKGPARSICNLN